MSRLLRLYEEERIISATPAAPGPQVDPEAVAMRDLWNRYVDRLPRPTLDDLTEDLPDDELPPLDRAGVDPSTLSADQRQWWEHGFLIKKNFIPDDLLDRYWARRSALENPGGWPNGSPFLEVPEALDLSVHRPLVDLLEHLIGEPMAVNLNLTGIISTERNWHQDDYLNYAGTKSWYCAVWFAVKDIDPDSGPFEYVPGSHRWPVVRRDRIRLFLPEQDRHTNEWPKKSEAILDPILIDEIAKRGAEVRAFNAEKGDVLIWHGRLIHRGSPPKVPGRVRHSFIAHYTGLNHWANGPNVGVHRDGGLYFLDA
jgi:hypothetical protein